MASILIGAGALAYEQVKKSKEKRAAQRAHNHARFAALEKETSARLSSPASATTNATGTCPCESLTWPGGDCQTHGYVPAADISASATPGASIRPDDSPPLSRSNSHTKNEEDSRDPAEARTFNTGSSNTEDHHNTSSKITPSYSDITSFSPGMASSQHMHRANSTISGTSSYTTNFPSVTTTTISSPNASTPVHPTPSKKPSTASASSASHNRRPSYQSTTNPSGYFVTISAGDTNASGASSASSAQAKAELKKARKAEKAERERERARSGNSNFTALYNEAKAMRETERGASSGASRTSGSIVGAGGVVAGRKSDLSLRSGAASGWDGNDLDEEKERERINEERRKTSSGGGGHWWSRKKGKVPDAGHKVVLVDGLGKGGLNAGSDSDVGRTGTAR